MNPTWVRIDKRGRIVIPAAVRRALGLKTGDEIICTCDDFGLIIKTSKGKEEKARA